MMCARALALPEGYLAYGLLRIERACQQAHHRRRWRLQHAMKVGALFFAFALAGTEVSLAADGRPVIITQPTNSTIFAGGSAKFDALVGGASPLTYQWLHNGTNLPGVSHISTTAIITTVAGDGNSRYSGDGGNSLNASLHLPSSVAIDADGNLFIADPGNNVVRKVESHGIYGSFGIITTVAGNGTPGFSGDGGPATNATLTYPSAVAFDVGGNLFIVDQFNNRIRKVDTNGIITTVAGSGDRMFYGDGGAATNANLNNPCGVALDQYGNLFIADQYNNRIRKVDANGIITTVAGGAGGFYGGYSGDGGPATNAELREPYGIAVDAFKNLFIADQRNYVIRLVRGNGIITTVAGNGRAGPTCNNCYATNANFYAPSVVAVDASGNLFLADPGNHVIQKVAPDGMVTWVAGNGGPSGSFGTYSGDGGAPTDAALNRPCGVALDRHGNLFIADQFNNRIRQVVASAGHATLALADVNAANAGSYQVVITNAYGSVTSSIATLTVTSPRISMVRNFDGSTTLNLLTAPNISSRVWAATNLTPPILWQPLYTNAAGINGTWLFTDTNTSQFPARYYRCSTP